MSIGNIIYMVPGLGGSPYSLAVSKSNSIAAKNTGTKVALKKSFRGFYVWSQLSGSVWTRMDFRDTIGARASCYVEDVYRLFQVYPAVDATKSGTWGTLNTATTGQASSYVTNRAASTSTNGNYLEQSVTGTEIWIAYTERTGGRQLKVTIDGDQLAANELPSNGTYRYLDCYGPVDLTRNRYIKIASGLTDAAHTVRLEVTSTFSDGTGSNGCIVEAFLVPSDDVNDSNIFPDAFPTSTAVLRGQEFLGANGYYYVCTADGTTAASEPTHTSGTAANGTASFKAEEETSYQLRKQATAWASEDEMASSVTISGTTEDFGGETHGGPDGVETSSSRVIQLDGVTVDFASMAGNELTATGTTLTISETLDWSHTNDSTTATIAMTRTLTAGKYRVQSTLTWQNTGAQVGFHYPAMMPFSRYDGATELNVFDTVKWDGGVQVNLADYSGISGTEVEGGSKFGCLATGTWLSGDEDLTLYRHVMTTPDAVNNYESPNCKTFVQTNRNGDTSSGSSTWQSKVYFERANTSTPVTVTSGDEWTQDTTYVWAVE